MITAQLTRDGALRLFFTH